MTDAILKSRIQDDMKSAMRAKEKERLGTIRMLLAAIKQREIDEQITLDDTQIMAVIEKMVKQRRDSIKQYLEAERSDLADIEETELALLQTYLPTQMTDEEMDALVSAAINESGAAGPQDIGKLMGVLKPKAQGRADMGKISQLVKAKLSTL